MNGNSTIDKIILENEFLDFYNSYIIELYILNFLLIIMNITIPLRNFNSVAVIVIFVVVDFCFFNIFVNNIYIQ